MEPSQSFNLPKLRLFAAVLIWAFAVIAALPRPASAAVTGAIYTTNVDASKVNQNLYENKDDVFLSGGPRPPACNQPGLAPDGDYYFQVTDPSGATLLSSDALSCRVVTVTGGVVTAYVGGCGHATGIPASLCSGPGLLKITVGLSPYDDTPNMGGVYKLWMTPVGDVAAGCDPTGLGAGCFVDASSKTDNFRVKNETPPELESELDIFKFCDANANGVLDPNELLLGLNGWSVGATGLSSCSGTTGSDGQGRTVCSPLLPGNYSVAEVLQAGFTHTATCHDGFCGICSVTTSTSCNLDTDCLVGETCSLFDGVSSFPITLGGGQISEVDFGNISKGSISGSKLDDKTNAPIQNLKVVLTGTQQVDGANVSLCTLTKSDGTYSFPNLLAGTYTATEMPPSGVISFPPTSCTKTLTLDGTCAVSSATCDAFRNACLGAGGGLTLGFWSNRNGQALETASDFTALTALNLVKGNGTAADFTGTLAQNKTALNSFLLGANAVNMANMLSAQLAAMELNVLHSKVSGSALVFAGSKPAGCTITGLSAVGFISINDLMSDANAELAPPGNVTLSGNPERACQEFKKNALDAANNNLNFEVKCPNEDFGQSCPQPLTVTALRPHKRRHHHHR